MLPDIEDSLNHSEHPNLAKLVSKLRRWLAIKRCEKSVQHLPTTCTDTLPFTNITGHPLETLSKYKLFVKLPKLPNHYLVSFQFFL